MLGQYREVFECLNSRGVKYVVIGGIGAILHGVPRATFDLDLLIEATLENVTRLLDAFLAARLGTADLITPETLLTQEITIFNDRIRIDVQTSTPGLTFSDAWLDKQQINYRGQEFFVASRSHIIASKRAAGRPIDLDDLRALGADEPGSSSA